MEINKFHIQNLILSIFYENFSVISYFGSTAIAYRAPFLSDHHFLIFYILLPKTVKNSSHLLKNGSKARYNFSIIIKLVMSKPKLCLLLCLLLVAVSSQNTQKNPSGQFFSNYQQGITYKKGLTFQATIWPSQKNNYAGRMSCNGCNPQSGDTSCTTKLPIACIIHPKILNRPFYQFFSDYTPYANPDQSFYEGWTGGIIAVTDPIRGLEITGYRVGDNLCKTAFGTAAKFATFTDGYHMANMNGPNPKMEKNWDWGQAQSGEYNFWGYFNHDHTGRSWVWTQTNPSGNCIVPNSNPIDGN